MTENLIDIEIIQITDPWNFKAHEKPQSVKSQEFQQFQKMHEEMNLYFKHLGDTEFYRCKEGDICAALRREDDLWHRVRIDKIISHAHGQQASCFMIDTGAYLTLSTLRLMELPKMYQEFPHQVYQCRLWGVQPLTLGIIETDLGLEAMNRPSGKWDLAAVEYMRKMAEESSRCQAKIVDKDPENTLFLNLYFTTRKQRVCFNDALIDEKYACKVAIPAVNSACTRLLISNDGIQNKTSASPESCGTKSKSKSGLQVIPSLIPSNRTNSLQKYPLSKFEHCHNGLGSNKRGLSDIDKVQQSNKQLELASDNSSLSSYANDPTFTLKKLLKISPSSESRPSSRSDMFRCDDAQPLLGSNNSDAVIKQPQPDQTTPSMLCPSKLTNLSRGIKLGPVQQSGICFSPGRGRGLILSIDNSPAHPDKKRPSEIFPSTLTNLSASEIKPGTAQQTGICFSPGQGQGLVKGNSTAQPDQTTPSVLCPSKLANLSRGIKPGAAQQSGVCFSPGRGRGLILSIDNSPAHPDQKRPSEIFPSNLANLSAREIKPITAQQTGICFSPGQGQGLGLSKGNSSAHQSMSVGSLKEKYNKSHLSNHASSNADTTDTSPAVTSQFHTNLGFMETLGQSGGHIVLKGPDIPIITRQDQPIPSPLFGVVVHGKSIPSLICNVDDVPFRDLVKTVLKEMDVNVAKSIQAWVWPAALSCRHVVGICPPNLGKTMSYIPAVVSHILDRTTYIELPAGKGPLVLIVVPSWKKGRRVHEMLEEFKDLEVQSQKQFKCRKLFKCNIVYAGGTEENEHNQISLMEGCDILIATPQSLLRLLEEDITSLRRLCHLILDDADLLATKFPKEVDEIMQLYKLQLKERKDQKKCLNVPRQIMIFASKWSDGVNEFYLKYTVEPVIAIASRVEAAVYGGVRQVVTMTRWEQRLATFCGLLDTLSTTRNRVAAFTQDFEEAMQMFQAASSRGVYCLLIHEQLNSETIAKTREQWLYSSHSKQLMVMVCTDQCYQDLAIINATMVIHYGLPDSKTKFGNRLACMLEYFLDRTSPVKRQVVPVSQVILTNKCAERAESLYEILQRCHAEYSPKLEKFLQGYKMGIENNEQKLLCPYLKSFGKCNMDKCGYRHLVLSTPDLKTGETTHNSLPSSGEVKIKVIHVKNASRYFCHLMEHRSVPDNIRTDLRLQYQQLMMDMITYFSKESNHVPFVPSNDPSLDGLCAFKDSGNIFNRAKVLKVSQRSIAAPANCKVWFVDAGRQETGTLDQLVKLPQRLAEVPYQAVEVYLCCIKPMDNDSEWTCEADRFIHNLIQGKELVGRIMLSAGSTLWLLPLVHQVTLKSVGVTSDVNIRQDLLDNKFGIPNLDHMQKLYELFRGKTEIPEKLMRLYYDYALEMEMRQETLKKSDKFYEVNIAAVISPGRLYVQKWKNFELLEKLQSQIDEVMKQRKENCDAEIHKADTDIKLEQGSVCLALSSDGRWYRAKIVLDLSDCQRQVFFLDYGDTEKVSVSDIKPLPRELAELPCQAIECELAYIQPYAEEWDKQAVDVICDLAYYLNEDKKQLSAKVVKKQEAHYGIGQKLVIDLYHGGVRFSQELVWRHMARSTADCHILRNLLEKPALQNQLFFNKLDKIPFLCSNIYWCESQSEAIEQADELYAILSCRGERWDTDLVEREVMRSAFSIVGYIQDQDAHGILLDCLVSCCVDSVSMMKLAISENLTFRLVSCLEQVSRPSIQLQAAQAIAQLVHRRSFCDSLTSNDHLVSVVKQLLNLHATSPEGLQFQILKCLCSASAKLVQTTNESVCDVLKSSDMIEQIFTLLKHMSADIEREPLLELLIAIATWKSSHKCLMRETHVTAVLDLLDQCTCEKCLYYLLSVCQSLVKESSKHKTILLENKLLVKLINLEASQIRSPALEVCKQLQEEMSLNFPEPQNLTGKRVENITEVHKIVSPHVTWNQDSFRINLKIKVGNAKTDDFSISSSLISCRSQSEGVLYEFEWELYDHILPAQSRVLVYASYAHVSLRKQNKGKWSHLLKQKVKLPNLSLDFEHLYSSEDEDEEDEEGNLRPTKKKSLFNQDEKWKVKRINMPQSSDESSDELAVYSHSSDDEPTADYESIINTIER